MKLDIFVIVASVGFFAWLLSDSHSMVVSPPDTSGKNSNAPWWFTSPGGTTPAVNALPQLAGGLANSPNTFGTINPQYEEVQF